MISIGKWTAQLTRTLLMVGLSVGILFVSNVPRVAAAPMNEHANTGVMITDCAAFCARTNSTPPQETVLVPEENRAPDPIPPVHERNLIGFSGVNSATKLRSYVYDSYSIRPPDILKLYGKYRF